MKANVIEIKELFDDLHDIIMSMKNYDECAVVFTEALDDFLSLSDDEMKITSDFIGEEIEDINKNAKNSAELVSRVIKTVNKHKDAYGVQTVLDAISKLMTMDFNTGTKRQDYDINIKLEVR